MPQTALVMTVIGKDRPGLVGELSAAVANHGGNWLESRMAQLGGKFAGILRIEIPEDRVQPLLAALRMLEAHGLVVRAESDVSLSAAAERTRGVVEVVGHDRPGIVREISQVLAQQQVNVEELTTGCESAPMSGELLFRATARVQLPASFSLDKLRRALEQIANDLMVDITVKPDNS